MVWNWFTAKNYFDLARLFKMAVNQSNLGFNEEVEGSVRLDLQVHDFFLVISTHLSSVNLNSFINVHTHTLV